MANSYIAFNSTTPESLTTCLASVLFYHENDNSITIQDTNLETMLLLLLDRKEGSGKGKH